MPYQKYFFALTLLYLLFVCAGCAVAPNSTATADTLEDYKLSKDVHLAIIEDRATNRLQDIEIEVNEGRVRLGGFVNSALEKARLWRIANSVKGVRGVDNELQIRASE